MKWFLFWIRIRIPATFSFQMPFRRFPGVTGFVLTNFLIKSHRNHKFHQGRLTTRASHVVNAEAFAGAREAGVAAGIGITVLVARSLRACGRQDRGSSTT